MLRLPRRAHILALSLILVIEEVKSHGTFFAEVRPLQLKFYQITKHQRGDRVKKTRNSVRRPCLSMPPEIYVASFIKGLTTASLSVVPNIAIVGFSAVESIVVVASYGSWTSSEN
jgi:hypothetical protein